MKTAKEEALDLIDRLPDDVAMETIMEGLRFKAQVLHSLEQIEQGEGVDHEEAKRRLAKWLVGVAASSGHPTRSTA
jgi:hypothetical protein